MGYDSLCFDSDDDFRIGSQNVSHQGNHIPLAYDVTSGFKQVYLLLLCLFVKLDRVVINMSFPSRVQTPLKTHLIL